MRYCPNCGTEVDETVIFCPTCGQAIDQAAEVEMPPAPEWPEPSRAPLPGPAPTAVRPVDADWRTTTPAQPMPDEADSAPEADAYPPEAEDAAAAPPLASHAPPPGPTAPERPVAAERPAAPSAGAGVNLPFSAPLTLSGWLIGGGAAVGALGALISLFDNFSNPVELILLVALLGVAATIFFATVLPHVEHLRLITLAVVLVGFGAALDRLGFGGAGIGGLLLLLGTAAAVIGAIILELGRDQPVGGS